jgi:ABC-type branched-subunit amino acid transport system substrate-binding protein
MIAPAGTDTLLTDRGLPAVNRIVGRDDVQGTVAAIFAAATLEAFGVTGGIELDAKGDRKKAVYSVLQVSAEAPERWGQNRVVKQVVAPAASRN